MSPWSDSPPSDLPDRSAVWPSAQVAQCINGPSHLEPGTAIPPRYRHHLLHHKMHKLPQEVVDMVIDKLAEFDKTSLEPKISRYSTVERRWIHRAQSHHFEHITFKGHTSLKKWRKTFKRDPSGVSKHVRQIQWIGIRSLEGFEAHLGAFTGVKETQFHGCRAFCVLPRIQPLMQLRSSLVRLEIHRAVITPLVMAFLHTHFPHIDRLLTQHCRSRITPFLSPGWVRLTAGSRIQRTRPL